MTLRDAAAEAFGWEPGGVVRLADVTPERVRWLWPHRLPRGKLVVIDGDPSVGKSTLTLDIAARVSTGATWPDGAPGTEPAAVLLLSAEDGLGDTIAPRLTAAGADQTKVHALVEVEIYGEDEDDGPRRVPPSLPRDIPLMERIIRLHGVQLLVVDVLMAFLSGKVDSHRDQDVRSVLHLLSAMAERTGCCILLVRHLNKAAGASALYRGGGSIGIIGAARAAYLVARDPDDTDRRIIAVTKLNIAVEPPALAYRLVDDPANHCARVVWEDAPTTHTAQDLLRGPADDDERTEQDEAADWLINHLRGNVECAAGDVIRAGERAGISKRTLQRARKRAGVSSRKATFGGGWNWALDGAQDDTRDTEGAEDDSTNTLASSAPSVSPSPEPGEAVCVTCGQVLLLARPGRDTCERCRIASGSAQ